MSFRRFIALLCLIAGSFGSGTVAALDCTITMGRSCQGVDNVFHIHAQFPLDYLSHFVIENRGAAECRLVAGPGTDAWWRGDEKIPVSGAATFFGPGHYRLSSGSRCDLSIRSEQDFVVDCPLEGSYTDGQLVGDGWKILGTGTAAWSRLSSRPGPKPEATEIQCQSQSGGQSTVWAVKVIPGNFSCRGEANPWSRPTQGTCRPITAP